MHLVGVAGSLSPLLLILALVIGGGRGAGRGAAAGVPPAGPASARLWDCGGGPLNARMEYTATSFAEPLQRVFDDVLRPEQDVDVTHHDESRLPRADGGVPATGAGPDRTAALRAGAVRGRRRGAGPGADLATGSVHRYLGYGFYTLCAAAGAAGGHPMTAAASGASLLQVLVVVALSPLLIGMMRQVRARLEGRAGAGVGQPWRDLRKLLRKQPVAPHGTPVVFRTAPLVLVATCLVVAAVVPFVTTAHRAGSGRRPVRGRGAAAAGHGRAGAGRPRHRHRVRRDGRQPGGDDRRAGRADAAGGDLRAVGAGSGRPNLAAIVTATLRRPGAGASPRRACSPRPRWSW